VDAEDASAIGARARKVRTRRGLSLDVAAGLAGISKPYLSALERGQRGFNRRGLVEDLANVATTAARRGYDLARQHDNRGLLGFARWYWALELTSMGARSRAHAVLSEGIDDLIPAVQSVATDTLPAEIVGMMHLQQARTAARQQRADDAHAHLGRSGAYGRQGGRARRDAAALRPNQCRGVASIDSGGVNRGHQGI
jgi:transcriptional regulator with XRE-family HTH domain